MCSGRNEGRTPPRPRRESSSGKARPESRPHRQMVSVFMIAIAYSVLPPPSVETSRIMFPSALYVSISTSAGPVIVIARAFDQEVIQPIRALAGKTIDEASILSGIVLPGSIADKVVDAYRKHLFANATLQALPAEPRFVINATNVHTRASRKRRFEAQFLADSLISSGLVERGQAHDPSGERDDLGGWTKTRLEYRVTRRGGKRSSRSRERGDREVVLSRWLMILLRFGVRRGNQAGSGSRLQVRRHPRRPSSSTRASTIA